MATKLTKRQLQAQQTQDNIYRTAVRLMQTKGFDNITIEEICKKAGVSVGSFYNRFKSKYDVLSVIFQEADDYFLRIVSANLDSKSSVRQKILHFFRHYGDYNSSCGVDFVKHLFSVQNKLFVSKGRLMQKILFDVVCEGQKTGEIDRGLTAEEMVEYLFIAARGIVFDWCQHDGAYDLPEYMESYMERMLTGIMADRPL